MKTLGQHPLRTMVSIFLTLGSATAAQAAAELVRNGDFETGSFSGWTQFGNTGLTSVDCCAATGSYAAFGSVGGAGGIFQTLSTVAGTSYQLSFLLGNLNPGTNSFDLSWDGISRMSLANAPAFAVGPYSITVAATSASTDLRLTFRQDPSYYHLDNVSVVAVSTVPEPAMPWLFGAGLAVLVRLSRSVRPNPGR